jgi:RNA polymerase sigma-70 factor (ECF subfamily)
VKKDEEKILFSGITLDEYSSFKVLFERYYGRLCAYVFTITNDYAASEDIVQELFIRFWNGRQKIVINDSVFAYLFRASRNSALNYIRGKANRERTQQNITFQEAIIDRDFLEEEEFIGFLDACIEALPERSRQVFKLSRIDGLKQKEIAERLNISVKTIKNQIWKSLQYLKSCLELKDVF